MTRDRTIAKQQHLPGGRQLLWQLHPEHGVFLQHLHRRVCNVLRALCKAYCCADTLCTRTAALGASKSDMPSMNLGTADDAMWRLDAVHWLYESHPGLYQLQKERHCRTRASILCDLLMALCAWNETAPAVSLLVAAPGTLLYT